MKYLSVCSGIEAATVAWHDLGWEPVGFSEIEAFPAAVLSHHYPEIPNYGDMTNFKNWNINESDISILVGGTPCQSFSVAGLRKGLSDDRGNLALTFCQMADYYDPDFVLWENVPGVLSSKDNAFGCFLAGLAGEDDPLVAPGGRWTNAGYVLGPKRSIAWRILDAQYFGVAQRRRRLFVVASPVGGDDPREILFESEGVRRDTAPSREAGERIAPAVSTGAPFSCTGNERVECDAMVPITAGIGKGCRGTEGVDSGWAIPVADKWPAEVASTLDAHYGDKQGLEDQHVNAGCPLFVPAHPIGVHHNAQACQLPSWSRDTSVSDALTCSQGAAVVRWVPKQGDMQIRRLTTTECERLQGFPDGYTAIPWRKKTAEECPDGPRYKALGNSMAVPVMRWIGERIEKTQKEGL